MASGQRKATGKRSRANADKRPAAAGRGRQKLLKTGELAAQSGLSRQVIYNYATLGLLRPVSVNRAGHKLFDATALVRIQLIQNLVARGYTLRDIRQIFFRER